MDIEIHSEYITLAQFLKKVDLISSGGEAKAFLANEQVYVNGEPEQRRGKKLYAGDRVLVFEEEYVLKAES
ncbi:S4 domain-containing protein YaaA [Alicyclobacillus tolerans]|uniref:S4 domain-containing protein YaaA n=1 Tax=Alicyclobacillus tolerans TaxID=90970 RepID=UPI001F40FF72|nr:S4 domain-containing protein YaaA [Alicyclobacillus tolerans]MCF8565715.1 S4 domain-containing protein YaaA [Alicyclobacillus tolerans]